MEGGPRTDADIVVGEAQHISDRLLAGIRRLRAGPHRDGAVLVRLCNRHMRLHVHVLLRWQHVPVHHPQDSTSSPALYMRQPLPNMFHEHLTLT